MPALAIAALLALGVAALAYSTTAGASTMNLDAIFRKHGTRYGVDPLLLKAIATVESSLNPQAINAADRYSVGLMQILFRPKKNADGSENFNAPENRFDVDGWQVATFDALKNPDFNVQIGAQILAWNIRNYGMPRGIAVYNAWNQRTKPLGGPFDNQVYVDKVLHVYRELSA